jgi:nucleotide-binding universal stress UspA family protein
MLSTDSVADAGVPPVEVTTVGPIVVATDGSGSAEPALIMARQLMHDSGDRIYVAGIHEVLAPPAPELAALPDVLQAQERLREALLRDVESQVQRVAGATNAGWEIVVRDGDPAAELSRISSELTARMLVIGVEHRHFTDRVFGRENALRLLQHCRVPLLIVPAGSAHPPKRALIATDFHRQSLDAGRAALRLFDSISHILLMHVTPSPVPPPQLFGTWREWLDEDTTRGFTWAKSELKLAPHLHVETVNREGHAGREIVHVARDRGVDLIVTGSRGAGLLNRLLTGSTARAVVHAADCAVLVVPAPTP